MYRQILLAGRDAEDGTLAAADTGQKGEGMGKMVVVVVLAGVI